MYRGITEDDPRSTLAHFGVKGMKWGIRRYQNKNDNTTAADKRRYSDKEISDYRKRKISEAPTKAESPRGANKGWYRNAPKSTLVREMRREEAESLKAQKKKATESVTKHRTRDRSINSKPLSKESLKKATIKGANIVSKLMLASVVDDVFYGGAGKKTVKAAGRAATEAWLYKHGSISVTWLD